MKTGEGKTLVATLPAYLNALDRQGRPHRHRQRLPGQARHGVDGPRSTGSSASAWGPSYHDIDDQDRYDAYRRDITYGTNNEFGFDYLRDNMKFRLSDLVQREFNYAIVDEVDSILIDEARTPLIISGPTDESTALYYKVDSLVRHFHKDKHFQVDEKTRTVSITETGVAEAEKYLGVSNLYDLAQMDLVHAINQSLKAHYLFKRDVDYMVKDGQVIIVDEFTGRLMPGRRYSDGLHQALEAKEKVKVEQEYQTLASITFQNYFRMYKKLAGMTGTALTEADGIPAHLRPRRRRDPDQHAPHPPGIPGRHLPDRGREMERRRRGDHREPTTRAGPSSSARSPSRNPSTSAPSSGGRTSSTSSSTPSTTSRKPRSSPRPGASAP